MIADSWWVEIGEPFLVPLNIRLKWFVKEKINFSQIFYLSIEYFWCLVFTNGNW